MGDIKKAIDAEVKRLARKEIKIAIKPLVEKISEMRKAISEQAKLIKTLKSSARNSRKQVKQEDVPVSSEKKVRLNAAGIRRIRTKLGITQTEFAKLLDVALSSVCNWELGRSKPRAAFVQRIVALRDDKKETSQKRSK